MMKPNQKTASRKPRATDYAIQQQSVIFFCLMIATLYLVLNTSLYHKPFSSWVTDTNEQPNEQNHAPIAYPKKSQYIKTIDMSEKSLAFSKIARVGKVSVFIISAHWCKPCETLKIKLQMEMESGVIDSEYTDVYYCLVTKNASEDFTNLSSRNAYKNLRDIDGLVKFFPTTYILAPTTNCFTWVEGAGIESQNKILQYIQELSLLAKNEFDEQSLETDLNNIN